MKYLKGFFVLVIVFALYACTAEEKLTHEEVFAVIQLTFQTTEQATEVKNDINLPRVTFEGVTFEWTSNNEAVAQITNNQIVVTRPTLENATVTVTFTLTIKDETQTKTFDLTIIKQDPVLEDKIYSVYVIGGSEEAPYEVKSGELLVLDTPSKDGYDFGGYYTDSNHTVVWDKGPITKTMTIYFKWTAIETTDDTAPIILGTHDFTHTIGDIIDYLLGVTVYDELGEDIDIIVDDSGVDLQTPDIYKLIYFAEDAAGNEVTTVVTVTVEALVEAVSLIETFDTASGSSSSYIDGDLMGVNGIKWMYVGMRNDQTLDGKAMTFGAKTTNSLKANIKGGIGSLSVQMTHAFSGDAERRVDLYINDVLIETFLVTTAITTYVKENIDVTGDFTLELRNTGGFRVTLDNITIKTGSVSPDLRSVNKDIQAFDLPSNIMTTQTIALPLTGLNGSAITYAFKDVSNTNNALINLSTGAVSVPLSNQVTVVLTVTFTKGDESKSITHSMLLGEGAPVTIKNALAQTGFVKTEGILTGFLVEATQIKAFFQDASGAIEALLDLAQAPNLTIGHTYIIKGDVTLNGYKWISNVTSLQKGLVKSFNPTEVSSSTLAQNQSKFVYLNGLVQKDYVSGTLKVATKDGVIEVINHTSKQISALLGQEISLNGHIVKVGQTYQIWVTDDLSLDGRAFNAQKLNTFVMDSLNLSSGMDIVESITLPLVDPLFGLNITWTSSNVAVLSNTGKVTTPEDVVAVTMSYVFNKGANGIYNGSVMINVQARPSLSNYYKSAAGLTGGALLSELTRIISTNYHSISYKATNAVLEVADKHSSGSGYQGIYDHKQITGYNKEHVWPQSSFSKASPYVSDMHHLRISVVSTNSARSNYYFNNPTGNTTSWEVGSSRFFPGNQDKGDIARMVMYMAVRYRSDGFRLIVAQSGRTSDAPSRTLGNLAVFYDWHLADPVDDFELNRNEVIFGTQKNRNPFIDHPELFHDVWSFFMAENNQPQKREEKQETYESLVTLTSLHDNKYYIIG